MQQKFFKNSLLLFLIGIIIASCSLEEDYSNSSSYQNKVKIMHKSFNELLKDQKFSKAYNKVQAQKNNAAKTVMEEQYQFTIADKPVKIVQSENGTTYTLLINRAIDDANTFENLVIKYENDGSINATIINYQPFYPLNTMDYFTNSAFNGLQSVTPIVYNDALVSTTGKISSDCYSVCTILCHDLTESGPYSVPHPPGSSCTGYNITIDCVVTCWGDNIGGEDTGNDIGTVDNTSGGGTSSSTNSGNVSTPPNNCGNCNNPIETIPVLELGEEEEVITPCDKLKNLFSPTITPSIKTVIQTQLQPNILINPYGEKGAKLQRTPNGTIGVSIIPSTTEGCIGIPVGGNVYCAIHTHPIDSRQPMFSWSDVYTLYQMNKEIETHNAGMASFLLVCQDSSGNFLTYAIVIEDLGNTVESVLNDPLYAGKTDMQICKEMDKKLYNDYVKEQNSSVSTSYERAFLNFMQGSNISLYKANNTLTNWSKLSLGGLQNDTVTPSPCK